jgi:hypothetical protein
MSTLRQAACAPHPGMSLARLEDFLRFVAQRLSAPDYAEAESLLHACVSESHSARRHRERTPENAA